MRKIVSVVFVNIILAQLSCLMERRDNLKKSGFTRDLMFKSFKETGNKTESKQGRAYNGNNVTRNPTNNSDNYHAGKVKSKPIYKYS